MGPGLTSAAAFIVDWVSQNEIIRFENNTLKFYQHLSNNHAIVLSQ